MEAECMEKLVDNRAKPEAASANFEGLKADPLRTTTTADNRRATGRVAVNVNKIGHCAEPVVLNEPEARVVINVISRPADLIHLSFI